MSPDRADVVEPALLRYIECRAPCFDCIEVVETTQGAVAFLRVDALKPVLVQPPAHEAIVGRANRLVGVGCLHHLGAANGECSCDLNPVPPRLSVVSLDALPCGATGGDIV